MRLAPHRQHEGASARRPRLRGAALWWPLLLLALSIAILVGAGAAGGPLQLANPDRTGVSEMRAAFDALPDDALVLVAMDADLGTYPEIRPAVRAALDDLLAGGASLAFVSVSVEGRAVAVAEQARLLAAGQSEDSLLDLGFISGVEAGMVLLVGDALPAGATGVMADTVAERGGGLAAFDMAMLVGGSDVGPRSWVEQVGTRLPSSCPWSASHQPSHSQSWRRTCAPASWWPCWPPSGTTPRLSKRSPMMAISQRDRMRCRAPPPCCSACWWPWWCWDGPWWERCPGCAGAAPRPVEDDEP